MIQLRNIFFLLFTFLTSLYLHSQNTELMIQTGHQSSVEYVALSPDESNLFTVDYDYVGILWDLKTGKQLRVFPEVLAGEFNADNRSILLFMNNSTFKTVDLSGNVLKINSNQSVSGKLTRWDRYLYAEQSLALYHGKMIDVNTGVYTKMQSNNSNAFVYAPLKGQVILGGSSGKIDICDARDGKLLRNFTLDLDEYGDAKFLNLSKDNNAFLACSRYKANILDFNTGRVLKVLKLEGLDILDAAMSPNAKTVLLTYKNYLQMIDVATGTKLWEQIYEDPNFRKAQFNASGDKIIVSGKGFYFLNSATGATLQKLISNPVNRLNQLFQTTDKKALLTKAGEKFMLNWNLTTGTMEKAIPIEETIFNAPYTVSTDGKKVFNTHGKEFREVDLTVTKEPSAYPKVDGGEDIWTVDVSFDNKYVLSSCYIDKEKSLNTEPLAIYDVVTHEKILDLVSTMEGCKFANTKNIVAAKDDWDKPIFSFYDVPSGKLLYQLTDPSIVSSANKMLFSNTDKYFSLHHFKGISIFDLATKQHIALKKDGYSDTYVQAYTFTPDDKYYIMGSNGGSIDFYNINDQRYEPNRTFKAHTAGIQGIKFSENGRYMFTASSDNTIKVWDWETKTLLATLYSFPDTNDWAVVTPGGRFDATKGAQESMYYVKGETTIPMSAMFEKFYTPHLLSRILEGEKIDPTEIDVKKLSAPPIVKILAPVEGGIRNLVVEDDKPTIRRYEMTSDKITLTLQAECASGGVSEIRLYHNNKLIGSGTRNLVVEDESKIEKNKTQKFEIILVEGLNSFRAVALNTERTESQADEINVNYKPVKATTLEESGTNLYMLVVGINKYKNPKYTLNYASADATGFKEIMEKSSNSIFNKVNIVYLGDENATKAGIVTAFDNVKETAKAKDVFIFYYAGHGVLNEKKTFYIVPQDVTQLYGNDDALEQKGISATDMQQFSKNIKAQKQLFILDACQSAGAIDQIVAARGAAEEKAISQLARSTGTHWLTASGSEQFASEFKQLGHGTFTYVLLEALSGKADIGGDKKVTVKELDAYLQEQVPEITAKYKGTAQYPSSYSYGNDFPIIVIK